MTERTDTYENHPIFDDLAAQFEEEFGYRLFTVVVEEDIDHDDEMIPVGRLPQYDSFSTSYPNEYLLHHSPDTNAATRIPHWSPFGILTPPQASEAAQTVLTALMSDVRKRSVVVLPDIDMYEGGETIEDEDDTPSPERRSIAEALEMAQRGVGDNKALDTVMDTIFGPKVPRVKEFSELSLVDMTNFLNQARENLLDKENYHEDELTPEWLVEEATRLYEESPIKMFHSSIKAIGDDAEAMGEVTEQVAAHVEKIKNDPEYRAQAKVRIQKDDPDNGAITIFYPSGTLPVESYTHAELKKKAEEFKASLDAEEVVGVNQDHVEADEEATVIFSADKIREATDQFTEADDEEQNKITTFWNEQLSDEG